MNATVILSVIMATAVSASPLSKFAYNMEVNDGKVESQTVYTVENSKFLHPHLKYNFIYDTDNRLAQKEVMRWNESTGTYQKDHCLYIKYEIDRVVVEYAAWNQPAGSYSDIKEKVIYSENEAGMNYQSYAWNNRQNEWNLVTEHSTIHWQDALIMSQCAN